MDFVFDPGLILYLPLYKLDGASFMSKDAYGHLCTVTGAVWRPHGRYFDGTDDGINCGNAAVLQQLTSQLTVSAWIKPTAVGGGIEHAVAGKLNDSGVNRRAWMVLIQSTGKLAFYISSDGTHTNSASLISTTVLSTDNWYHVTASYRSASWFLSVNGVIENSGTPGKSSIYQNTVDPLYVGRTEANPRYFQGTIGRIEVYNRALNVLEAQRNYLATKWRYR